VKKAKKDLNENIKNLQMNQDNFTYWTKSCFVVFNTISDYEKYYSYFPHSWYRYISFKLKIIFSCCCKAKAKGKSLTWMKSFKVEKAPEPEDVIWENFVYSSNQRICRKIQTLLLTILLTVLNLGVILSLNYADVN